MTALQIVVLAPDRVSLYPPPPPPPALPDGKFALEHERKFIPGFLKTGLAKI